MLAFFMYLLIVWYVEVWMLPIFLIIFMLSNLRMKHASFAAPSIYNDQIDDVDHDKAKLDHKEKNNNKEPESGIMRKIFVDLPDGALAVQNGLEWTMGFLRTHKERSSVQRNMDFVVCVCRTRNWNNFAVFCSVEDFIADFWGT